MRSISDALRPTRKAKQRAAGRITSPILPYEAPRNLPFAQDASVEFLQPVREGGIAGQEGESLRQHIACGDEIAVADVAIGAVIKEVDPLRWRKTVAEAGVERVGPGGMPGHGGDGDLIGAHGRIDPGGAGKTP